MSLKKKNQLLEQIHQYLSDNNLYPEDLENKEIKDLVSSAKSTSLDKDLNLIEMDEEVESEPKHTQKKKSGRPAKQPQLSSFSSADLKKIGTKQPRTTVKRLD